jgi:allantoate deiminase
MAHCPIEIDRHACAQRIAQAIETLSGPQCTLRQDAICRYAYTDAYRATLRFFREELEQLDFSVSEDAVGNFVARNRAAGERAFGIGSHCDSHRNGGKYDGTLGVVAAMEVCRLNKDLGLNLPLQVIAFLEEEGSGFGQTLLGSRIMTHAITEDELNGIVAIDDGRSLWEHAREAGYNPAAWRSATEALRGLSGWLELHIEQGRVLQDTTTQIGVVTNIVGVIWADIMVYGRADHAGATPMDMRLDASVVAAECVLALERMARAASPYTVGTVGECHYRPGLINGIPGAVRLGVDIRSVDETVANTVAADLATFAIDAARRRGMTANYTERLNVAPGKLSEDVVRCVDNAAQATGASYRRMPSGGGHDTQLMAPHVPSGMVFVPCRDGLSHDPEEYTDPADAALGVEIMLNAIHCYENGDAPA